MGGPDHGHGHGIYAQNETGTRRIVDNIVFDRFGHGIHAYGSSRAPLNNFDLEGNTVFRNGDLGGDPQCTARRLQPGRSPTLSDNYLYYPPGGPISALDLG